MAVSEQSLRSPTFSSPFQPDPSARVAEVQIGQANFTELPIRSAKQTCLRVRRTCMDRQDVDYWCGDQRISGWFYPAAEENAPALLFCPGYTGTKFAAFYTPYVERFVASGWSVLLSDYRGWGESEGLRGEIVPLRQVEDVRMGLTYLSSRPDVDAGALSLFGVSFGGGVATYAAAIDERVRACAVVSPVADGRAWLHGMRREYEWREFTEQLADDAHLRMTGAPGAVVSPGEGIMISTPERRATTIKGPVPEGMAPTETPLWCAERIIDFRPCDVASRISPRALLLFCVSHDDTVPPRHAELLYERARGPKKLVRFEGNTHYGTYMERFEAISKTTNNWLERHGRTVVHHETEAHRTVTGWIASDDRLHTTDSKEE
jgi:hypothetical protein